MCRPKTGGKPSSNNHSAKTPQGGQQLTSSSSMNRPTSFQPSPPSKPRTVICYICGREFGSKSLPIHEPQCLRKWKNENSKLPRGLQKPMPRKPSAVGGSSASEAARNAAKENLVACRKCGRTFRPDRIEKHESVCRPKTGTVLRPTTATLGLGKEKQSSRKVAQVCFSYKLFDQGIISFSAFYKIIHISSVGL